MFSAPDSRGPDMPLPPAPSCFVRPTGPQPIAYQVDDERVLCAPGCLSHAEAQALVDAGQRAGDVQPWTVDLDPAGCGRVLVAAPPLIEEEAPLTYDEIQIGQIVRVTSREGWVARVVGKFKSVETGIEYVELVDDGNGCWAFNYPSQLEAIEEGS